MAEPFTAFGLHNRAGCGIFSHPQIRSRDGRTPGIVDVTRSGYCGIELHAFPTDCFGGRCVSRADRADVVMDLRELPTESVHIAFRANPAISGLSRPMGEARACARG